MFTSGPLRPLERGAAHLPAESDAGVNFSTPVSGRAPSRPGQEAGTDPGLRPASVPLTRGDIGDLEDAVDGPVLLPPDPEYVAECATYNLLNPLNPAIAVGVTSVGDVEAAIRWAVRRGLAVAVSATGHQVRVPATGALLINLRRMAEVQVDAPGRKVRISGGAQWRDVVQAAAAHGLAPVNGSSPTVGAVGYLLGGGLSPTLGRTQGYGADTVRAVEIVAADGVLRRVDADTDPDLFFAVRGGKGNFGVVTAVEADLFPVRSLYGGVIYFSGEDTAPVLHAWREWVSGLPREMTTSIAVQRLPAVPELPQQIRGAFVVALRIAYLGANEEAERLVARMRAAAPVLLDGVGEMSYSKVADIHSDPAQPISYVDRTTGLRALSADTVEALIDVVGPDSNCPLASVEIRALGGALDDEPRVPNAVSTRGLPFVLFGFGVGGPDQVPHLRAHLNTVITAMGPWADHRLLPNFLSADEATTPAAVRAVYGAHLYDRLARIKARWDPQNTFRMNHNIPPLHGTGPDTNSVGQRQGAF